MSNRPNNHFIKDATSPYTFTYSQYGISKSIVVDQSANEDTWPGGALWDIGVLMAKLLVMIQSPSSCYSCSLTSSSAIASKSNNPKTQKNLFPPPPKRILAPEIWGSSSFWKEKRILELGCGVGLTGLVASALGARAVLLTDLEEVVKQITKRNVDKYKKDAPTNSSSRVEALTLCWGNKQDERRTADALDAMAPPFYPHLISSRSSRKKKGKASNRTQPERIPNSKRNTSVHQKSAASKNINRKGIPDVILIGDVAYQHKPGATSHFDILLSTSLQFSDEHTLLIFGTRMRMPASVDLLQMFRKHFQEIVDPPIEAHEIDPAFDYTNMGRKHNITIHIMRKRPDKSDF